MLWCLLALLTDASGAQLYVSAQRGTPGETDGYALSDAQYLGVRFRNYEPWRIEEVGGHLYQSSGTNGLFAAIVPLASQHALPASPTLTDAVWSATFNTAGLSSDVLVEANVVLEPGWWVLVFGGGGAFGSDGAGGMTSNNTEVGYPSFVRRVNGIWEESGSEDKRFVVKGYIPCIPDTLDTGMSCPEDCFDGHDNDADDLVDCQDRECWHLPECCDADEDGFARNEALCGFGPDCDDSVETGTEVYPGALEIINDGIDSDCDGVELCYTDADGDGHGIPRGTPSTLLGCVGIAGVSEVADDCDDSRPTVYPGAVELPGDAIDGDCDGREACFVDEDEDGFGTDAVVVIDGVNCAAESQAAFASGDCRDVGSGAAQRYPGAPEIIGNALDEDCDGRDTCWVDLDGDRYGSTQTNLSLPGELCDASPLSASMDGDCDDVGPDARYIYPGAPELAGDGVDQDCDGRDACFLDGDGDGFGSNVIAQSGPGGCEGVLGLSARGDDCDDDDPLVSPGAAEIVGDAIDQDCNGRDTCFHDFDLDSWGGPVTTESPDLRCDAHAGLASRGGDCVDAGLGASRIHPGAEEGVSDGVDQNCDGEELCWIDGDGDGFGGDQWFVGTGLLCGDDPGEPPEGGDCDDADPTISPASVEVPGDGVDQDCDGGELCFEDRDGDGAGGPDLLPGSMPDCRVDGAAPAGDDCDDEDDTIFPGAWEVAYDLIDQDCDGVDLIDIDQDGFLWTGVGGLDCDDDDGTVAPNAPERANGLDDDCDGEIDEGTDLHDDDGDGYAEAGGDCDDDAPGIHPGAVETCDGIDQDCDRLVDEQTRCVDDDGDGYSEDQGDCNDDAVNVHPGRVDQPGNGIDDDCDGVIFGDGRDLDGDGYTELGGDCQPRLTHVHPGAPERPDGLDNDCDGRVDEGTQFFDDDGDGLSENQGDCDDTDATIGPDQVERINGVDDDCDGRTDNVGINGDADGDGFTVNEGDCDDNDATVVLLGEELPDGKDNDCDGLIDEGLSDLDHDGWTVEQGDCNDGDGWANPEADEVCDAIDNNCDGRVDEGCLPPEVVTVEVPRGCQHGGGTPWGAAWLIAMWARCSGSRARSGGRATRQSGAGSCPLPR